MAHYNSVLRLRRQPMARTLDVRAKPAAHMDEDSPRLLISPAFWFGGAMSVAAWMGLAKLFGLF